MLLSPLRNERKPLICSWCLRAHDLMCCGYLGDGALSPADLGVVFLADPALLAAQPKKSGAARLEFVCFLPWAQVLCAPENFAVSLQQTLVFSSFVVGGSLLFTCRLFPLSPFPEAAKSQKALGAAHEQQGLRPARATRTRRATASAATKATGKHRQQSSRGGAARRADQHNQGQRLSLAHMQRGATKAATQLSAAAAEAAASAATKVAPRAVTAIAVAAAAAAAAAAAK